MKNLNVQREAEYREAHKKGDEFDLNRRQVTTGVVAALIMAELYGCCGGEVIGQYGQNEYEIDFQELLDEDSSMNSLISGRMRDRSAFFREFETDGQDIKFTSRTGLFEQLKASHPKLVKDAEEAVSDKGFFGRKKDPEEVRLLRENFTLQALIKEYQIGSDTEDFELQEGADALDEQELRMGGLKHDVGTEYLKIPAEKNDDLEEMLRAIIKKSYRKYVREFVARIFILSPDGYWHIPRAIIDEEKFKDDVFWIEFKQLDSYTYPSGSVVTDEDRKYLKRGGQSKQVSYHKRNNYPRFTNDEREDLLKTSGVVEVPQEGDSYVWKDIYTKDPDNEALAAYTYPETLALIESLGEYVNQVYHKDHNLPEHIQLKLIVNALGRTTEYQKKLSGTNRNATSGKSSHTYYNAADISYMRIQIVDTKTRGAIEVNNVQHPKLMAGVRDLLSHKFAEEIKEDRALGVKEIYQQCFHVVGKREEEDSDDDSAED